MAEEFNLDVLANMSDDDFMGKDYIDPDAPSDSSDSSEEDGFYNQEEYADIPENTPEEDEPEQEQEQSEEDEESSEGDTDESDESEGDTSEDDSEDDAESGDDEVSELTKNPDELLAKLFSPFAANGTQIKVDTVEEAIELMQMGANYHKKMSLLKPHLRFIKALESKGLLNDDRINFAIDLLNNDEKAITKLIADGKIDPLDLKTDEVDYSPTRHVESEQSHNLNEILATVQNEPEFKATMDVITTAWDVKSRDALVAHPERIQVLVAHKANGTFDLINAQVARMRMFGQLPSTVSDMDAYEQVGMQLMQQQRQQPTKVDVPASKPKNTEQKKRVAQPKAQRSRSKTPNSIDELADLSDEEFAKISSKYF